MKGLVFLTLLIPALAAAGPVRDHRLVAELVPEMDAIVPGETLTICLNIKHDPHWHTYWQNPGIAGVPTKLEWDLPQGFEAGPIQWARPQRVKMAIYNTNGYEGEVTLLVDIKTPKNLEIGTGVEFRAKALWMMCADACYPSSAKLSVTVPVAASAKPDKRGETLAAEAREAIPKENKTWKTRARMGEKKATLILEQREGNTEEIAGTEGFYFFSDNGLIDSHQDQKITKKADGSYKLVLPLAEFRPKDLSALTGVLLYKTKGAELPKALFIKADLAQDSK